MEFEIKTTIHAPAEEIYRAWLNSEAHSNMTGGEASISDKEGAKFSAWDGYIVGENLELEPYGRILQKWRTSSFEDEDPDSHLEIVFDEVDGRTEITLIHTNIPEDGEDYETGWEEHYFQPMKEYFEN